jgi:phosphoribosylaminoimidazole carboxylase (NCAIR synthetase)
MRLLLLLPTTTYRTTAFVEAARRAGVALTVASETPSTLETVRPDALLTLDFAAPEHAAEQVKAFAQRTPITAALGVDDDTVVVATAINHALGRNTNPLAAAHAARDKYQQRQLLAKGGVPVPPFALHSFSEVPATLAASAPYPCVLKPLRLSASRGVIRADTPEQFVAAHRRLQAIVCGEATEQFLVEAFVPGYEVAIEGLLTNGELQVLALFDKPDPLDGPFFEETIYVTPSRHPQRAQAALSDCAADAARALGLSDGPMHAELRFNEHGPWLIELAARPIGGRCSAVLRFENGERGAGSGFVSLEEIVIRHAVGMELPTLERERQAAGVMMIPVPKGGVLREVRGVSAAESVPGVSAIDITAHRGQRLVPWPEGSRYPGFIFARGDTPAAVERSLRAAHRHLEFVLEAPAP